jgi:aminoglycoside phosphotransferase (APT) family kinase protein
MSTRGITIHRFAATLPDARARADLCRMTTPPITLPAEVMAALAHSGLLGPGEAPMGQALSGGVSADIWRVDLRQGPVCVKRALPQLRVAARWEAPVSRNAFEVAWIEVAGAVNAAAVPRLRGHDERAGLFIMDFLEPARHRLWKTELREGRADAAMAAAVGARLVQIHAATAGRAEIARRFPTDAIFHAIRLAPYLEAAAQHHPGAADALHALVLATANTHEALVHGDVSPKNIMLGPDGPIFLDAECAWYGDPAFDIAFCLNHLLLKCLWAPQASDGFARCFRALVRSYGHGVSWTGWPLLEARAARLLPGLLLARIDGKSPVEYITDETQKDLVRGFALALLRSPVTELEQVLGRWLQELPA